jgi:hypothetical protein
MAAHLDRRSDAVNIQSNALGNFLPACRQRFDPLEITRFAFVPAPRGLAYMLPSKLMWWRQRLIEDHPY